jgi:protein-disulfide isomerase
MTPPPRNYEERERRHWAAFWQEVPPWAKTAIIALGAAAGTSYISASPKDLPAQVQAIELKNVRIETQLDSMQKQLDRMERLLERRLGPTAAKVLRSEVEG